MLLPLPGAMSPLQRHGLSPAAGRDPCGQGVGSKVPRRSHGHLVLPPPEVRSALEAPRARLHTGARRAASRSGRLGVRPQNGLLSGLLLPPPQPPLFSRIFHFLSGSSVETNVTAHIALTQDRPGDLKLVIEDCSNLLGGFSVNLRKG